MGCWVFSATCRIIEWTILLLLYLSSHLMISSGDTLRFERSMYPAIPFSICFVDYSSSGAHPSPCRLAELPQLRCAQLWWAFEYFGYDVSRVRRAESCHQCCRTQEVWRMRPFRRSNGLGQQISHVESVAQSSYLLHIHHNKTINLRILFLIETAISQWHICGCCAAGHGLILILFLGFVASCCEIVVGNFSMILCSCLRSCRELRGFCRCRVKIVGWQSHNLYSDFGGLYANKVSAGFAPPVAEWERAPCSWSKASTAKFSSWDSPPRHEKCTHYFSRTDPSWWRSVLLMLEIFSRRSILFQARFLQPSRAWPGQWLLLYHPL